MRFDVSRAGATASNTIALLSVTLGLAASPALAQFDSGSDGSDGALNPGVADFVIDMASHPDGVFHYTSVNIPQGVTVTFIPNEDNTPVTWLVQGSVTIDGTVDLRGRASTSAIGAAGGPGGFRGGNGGVEASGLDPGPGRGPGGGQLADRLVKTGVLEGGDGSYAVVNDEDTNEHTAGRAYGNMFLLPLIGGSGGGGGDFVPGGNVENGWGGGGGGGALLIAANDGITVNGTINARGGGGNPNFDSDREEGGFGSGGAIRLVAPSITGSGSILASRTSFSSDEIPTGRVRIEGDASTFMGVISNVSTFSPTPGLIMLPENTEPRLRITSIGGIAAPADPTADPFDLDVDIPMSTTNPVDVEVAIENLAPGTDVTVVVKPEHGEEVRATGTNIGTFDSSTATIPIDVPPGAGIFTVEAVSGS